MASQDTKPRVMEKTSSYTDQPLTCKSAVEGQNALSSLKTVSVYQESHNHFSQVMGNGFPIFLFSSTIFSLDPHLICHSQDEEICNKNDTESWMIQIVRCVSCVALNMYTKKLHFVTSRDYSCHRQVQHRRSLFQEGICYSSDAVRC